MGDTNSEQAEGPTNDYPPLLTTAFSLGIEIVQKYGWFIVAAFILAVYLRSKFGSSLSKWKQNRDQENYKKYDLDPSVAAGRLEAMERSRQRMQEQFDSQAMSYAEKQKRREEEKRQEKIENWDRHLEGKGSKSKYKPKEETSQPKPKPKKPLRQDGYNPLMGDPSRYRPSRSSRGGGG